MLTVLFPGSFDPPTNGHLNIIHRISGIYDKVYVVVADNAAKSYTFDAKERLEMAEELVEPYENVEARLWSGLIVRFAEDVGARLMVRGVRALADFNYEFELSMVNRGLSPIVETIFIPTDPQYFVLRSSAIKELARLGGDITTMVPPNVAKRLQRKMAGS
ncbi:MAG: pantetheine-phosphate adenylyltransferase [Spirochaetaceae bacterium]|nr:MAG: pantetheine-phosphate adenylyltransferase [Spirochaetaceae bacterium]